VAVEGAGFANRNFREGLAQDEGQRAQGAGQIPYF